MENNDTIRLPIHFEEFDGEDMMSNFHHSIDNEIANKIKGKELFSRYAGRDFNGKVWWDTSISKWCCEVWTYGSWSTTVVEEELQDIMGEVCSEYGSE